MKSLIMITAGLLCVFWAGVAVAQGSDDPRAKRVELARLAYLDADTSLDLGMTQPERVYQWSLRWLTAQREQDPAKAGEALTAHRERMVSLRTKVEPMIAMGMLPAVTQVALDYYVIEAEVWAGGPDLE